REGRQHHTPVPARRVSCAASRRPGSQRVLSQVVCHAADRELKLWLTCTLHVASVQAPHYFHFYVRQVINENSRESRQGTAEVIWRECAPRHPHPFRRWSLVSQRAAGRP